MKMLMPVMSVLLLAAGCAHESPFAPTPAPAARVTPPATLPTLEPVFLTPPTTQPAPTPDPPAIPGDVYYYCDHTFVDWDVKQHVWPDWTALVAIPLWDEQPQDTPHIVHGTPIIRECLAQVVGTPAWSFQPDIQGSPSAEPHHGDDPYTLWVRTGARGTVRVCSSVAPAVCGGAEVPAGPHGPQR